MKTTIKIYKNEGTLSTQPKVEISNEDMLNANPNLKEY